jgi:myosin-5
MCRAHAELCAGAPDDLRNALKLGPPESFHYTNQSDTTTIDGVDDAADYLELTEAMDHCGFSTEEVHTVFQLLAGILHLGNVAYEPDSQDNASLPAASKAVTEDTAHYLGVDVTTLQKNLVTTEVKTRGETFNKPLSVPNAGYVRDALAKAVYGRVFDWLVLRIDDAFAGDCEPRSFIGVLDIYGFEFFELNSFEQLCINFANEKLQMHFNQSVFNQEKAMYAAEAITVPEVAYRDNAGVIDAIEAKGTGILDLLDQTCKMPRATDQAFCEAVQDRHQRSKVISPPRMSSRGKKGAPKQRNFRPDEAFVVKHFAGDVTYCVDGFLAKNMDPLNDGLLGMLVSSSVELVAALFAPTAEEGAAPKPGSRKKKKATVSTKFKKQLNLLTESLASTTSHFIRCVKPNVQKKPKVFEGPKVMDQLRCSGMIEALELMVSCRLIFLADY